jgi:membrane-associated phospholipid phosphatase
VKFAIVYLQNVLQILKSNKEFYISFILIWFLGLYFQICFTQFDLSLWVNGWHTSFLDLFMVYLTYAGDGILLVVCGFVIILVKPRYWLLVTVSLTIPSLITQLLKHFVFENEYRPVVMMKNIHSLYFVPGVEMNQFNSFPSGHTTAAFSLYTLLALLTPSKKIGFLWVIIAALVSISRVYLLQHFWVDIMTGALIGGILTTLIFVKLEPKQKTNGI